MKAKCQKLFHMVKKRAGFTLIEMLIVVIILGILAMIIVPQITVTSDDAKVSAAKSNLSTIRGAIGLYHAQHNNTYPTTNIVSQLTLFSNSSGATSGIASNNVYNLGPYIKGVTLPANPFNDLANVATVNTADLTAARTTDGTTGWRYWDAVGVIFLNDGGQSGVTNHSAY